MLPVAASSAAAALHFIGIFAPGNIDHHNVQLVLTLAAIAALSAPASGFRQGRGGRRMRGADAGGRHGNAALCGGRRPLRRHACFLVGGRRASRAGAAASAPLSRSPRRSPSSPPFRPAPGWPPSATHTRSRNSRSRRSPAPASRPPPLAPLRRRFATRLARARRRSASLAAATVVLFFPQCLADPYAGLDPRLKTYWLSADHRGAAALERAETQSGDGRQLLCDAADRRSSLLVWKLRRDGASAAGAAGRGFPGRRDAVSIWQVRGSMFAIPLATIPLAAWVGEWRARAAAGGDRRRR